MVDEAWEPVSRSRSQLSAGPLAARIGNQVRSWRQELGISEADLASTLRLSVDEISSAENGDPCFTAEQIVTICQAFTVSPSRFLENIL